MPRKNREGKRPDAFKEWDEKHIARWAPKTHIQDRKSFPFPRDLLSNYPHLIEACEYLHSLYTILTEKYQASVKEEEEEDDFKRQHGWHYRQMKRLRRKLAPQLMLVLEYIEEVWLQEVSVELRQVKEVKRVVQMVQKDKKMYNSYEPIFSLYQTYLRNSSLFTADESSMDDVLARVTRLMWLRVAVEKVTIRVGGLKDCFPDSVGLTVSESITVPIVRRNLTRAMTRLELALKEWRMIELFVEYCQRRYSTDETDMLVTVETIIPQRALQEQMEAIRADQASLALIERRLPLSLESLRLE